MEKTKERYCANTIPSIYIGLERDCLMHKRRFARGIEHNFSTDNHTALIIVLLCNYKTKLKLLCIL